MKLTFTGLYLFPRMSLLFFWAFFFLVVFRLCSCGARLKAFQLLFPLKMSFFPHVRFFCSSSPLEGNWFFGWPITLIASLSHCFAWTVELLKGSTIASWVAELWDISGNHTAPSLEISLEITPCSYPRGSCGFGGVGIHVRSFLKLAHGWEWDCLVTTQ